MKNTGFKRAPSAYSKGFYRNAVGDTVKAEDGSVLRTVAEENWGFWTPGGRLIYYGNKDGGFKKLTPGMGDMKCDSATFGGDPAVGLYKSCYEVITPAPTQPASTSNTSTPSAASTENTTATSKSGLTGINWPLWGGAAAVLTIGTVLYFKFR